MNKKTEKRKRSDDLRPEYDLSKLRGVFEGNTRRVTRQEPTSCFFRPTWPNISPTIDPSTQLCAV